MIPIDGPNSEEISVSDRSPTATTQQAGSRGAIHSAQEWPQACRPMASAQPTPDQDPVSRSVPDERGRGWSGRPEPEREGPPL